MRKFVIGMLLLAGVAACGSDVKVSLPGLVHYDDFFGSSIDVSRWNVDTTGDGVTGTATQTVANGIATLDIVAVSGDIQSTLEFPASLQDNIAAVGSRVTPLNYTEGGGSNVRFRHFIRAYKDNKYASGPAPDLTSDIFAQLRMRAGQFQALVSRCVDSGCGSEVIFGPTVLGPVTLSQTYDVRLSWDGGTVFFFSVAGVGTALFDATEGGTYAPVGPSGSSKAQVEVIATSGAPTTGDVAVELDWVSCARPGGGIC